MRNPFKTKQAIEILRLLTELEKTPSGNGERKIIMADILAEAGLILNIPARKAAWIRRT